MAVPSVGQSYTWDNFVQEYTDGLLTSDDDAHEVANGLIFGNLKVEVCFHTS